MKKIVAIVKATVLIMPCLLVFNESETLVPNLIGLTYIGCLFLHSRTAAGTKMWKNLYRYLG